MHTCMYICTYIYISNVLEGQVSSSVLGAVGNGEHSLEVLHTLVAEGLTH